MFQENAEIKNNISKFSNIKGSGVGTYIINMDRSIQRYDYVKDSVQALGFNVHRISAVDESKMNQHQKDKYIDLKTYINYMGRLPQSGAIGCYLSHIKTWEAFLASSYEFAVVFEDDVSFDPVTLRSIIDELIIKNRFWDISSFDILHRGNPLVINQLTNNHQLALYLYRVSHSGAYIINRAAGMKLLEKSLPIKMPIDWYFPRSWEFDLKFTGVENPRIVHQTFEDSNIDYISDNSVKHSRMLHMIFRCQDALIRCLYNLKLYIEVKYFGT